MVDLDLALAGGSQPARILFQQGERLRFPGLQMGLNSKYRVMGIQVC